MGGPRDRFELVDDPGEAMRAIYPELDEISEAAEGDRVYLVGGAVRDLLLGRDRADLDVVVIGDAAALAARLSGDPVEHERFATAKAHLDGHDIDIATARAETYARPGALPDVRRTTKLETDLLRRDFTVNAMAIPLQGPPELVDPFDGRIDLKDGILRLLYAESVVDDPTRALRAARYAARYGFEPSRESESLLCLADLGTVSAERREADLLRLATEANAARGFEMLAGWELVEPREGGIELARRVGKLLLDPPWRGAARRDRTVLTAALGPVGGEVELAAARPARPSEGVELARGHTPEELALARALGAEWLDRYLLEWRPMQLEIGGEDLIVAGVPEGPEIGRGLAAALRAKLDGEVSGREQELAVALRAARESAG